LKAGSQIVISNLLKLRPHLGKSKLPGLPQKQVPNEPPLRSELFSADQMEQYGRKLAASHKLSSEQHPDQLLKRLSENETVLADDLHLLTTAVKEGRRITPAEEWLVDNFYLIEEQIRLAKRHLPKNYSQQLPRLGNGRSAGLPRVYDIALEIISHGDGRVDPDSLSRFIVAYQTVQYLKLGELWAIPIMLRLALIENLRRIAGRVAGNRIERDQADFWAQQMVTIAEEDPKSLILVIADMARSKPPMGGSFVSELVRRLQGQSAALALALPLTWIEQWLSESGLTIAQLIHSDSQQQAIEQVSISNCIASLRFLESMNWQDFVESKSIVEHTLLQDPSGTYRNMDFATRDHYRHVIENTAKSTTLSEGQLAQLVIKLAQEAMHSNGRDMQSAHVGFYLIDEGLPQFKKAALIKSPFWTVLETDHYTLRLLLYVTAIAIITVLFSGFFLLKRPNNDWSDWLLITAVVALLVSASQFAITIINWLVTLFIKPEALPRMDFSEGIPIDSRTLVVIPSMLLSNSHVDELVETLEVHFLANQDNNLHFGLLTDFTDASEEITPLDETLLSLCKNKIEALNDKHSNGRADTFFLFQRPRKWNGEEKIWMGYERKRGKLGDLNALLRGYSEDRFLLIVGKTRILAGVKYVITLDTDTQLPRDEGRRLTAAMAHPLNHPRFDNKKRLVAHGYGILQPRVSTSLPDTNRSLYAQLNSAEPGIDPYTRTVSDVYQDLFAEGSFIGKGIYDVDAFEHVLKNRFPENRILSHDLLEGCYIRSGLLSDVELYENYPISYITDFSRRQRWIRGDWQLLGWLLPTTITANFGREKNPLSALSKWKLFDNLRRSLVPIALLILLLLAFIAPSRLWTLAVLAVIFIPSLIISIFGIFRKPENVQFLQHYAAMRSAARRHLSQGIFTLATLPYEALSSSITIINTLMRVLITHQKLLQWNSARETENRSPNNVLAFYQAMWCAPTLAIVIAGFLLVEKSNVLITASPVFCLWFISPLFAWWLSQPRKQRISKISAEQLLFLRALSRRTWSFFETFVSAEDNWLPPDNYQQARPEAIAHRTSPTNIGLALLSTLSAYDFGYISMGQLIRSIDSTLTTMDSLERYRGHFYNWYDTQTLQHLSPAYISTVDSGNLAGCLFTLQFGLSTLPNEKIVNSQLFSGLSDTLSLVVDSLDKTKSGSLRQFKDCLEAAKTQSFFNIKTSKQSFEQLANYASNLVNTIDIHSNSDAHWWASALFKQCLDALEDLKLLTPWTSLKYSPDDVINFPDIESIPTLQELARFPELLPQPISDIDDNEQYCPVTESDKLYLELCRTILQGSRYAKDRINTIIKLTQKSNDLGSFKYDFLFDKTRRLLSIGYNVDEHRLDQSYYDLLASEARLTYFLGIAQGQLPKESWFALGRLLTTAGGEPILVSWSGSMFEYLMPLLFMPTYENTLLDETCKAAVKRQIEYVKNRGVPWGISECGYNILDLRFNYQYRAFGVPGLGLKRGLAEDLVIAPYASTLALMVEPEDSCTNLQQLALDGFTGKYGFYEAIDYTPSRLLRGQSYATISSFMAHHQGMSFLALNYLIYNKAMPRRFELDPAVQATRVLLHERVPMTDIGVLRTNNIDTIRPDTQDGGTPVRIFDTANTTAPEIQLLSNGRYHVMITNAGGSYSSWKDLAVTRWREDTTLDNWGTFCYIRDEETAEVWSVGYQPTHKKSEDYEAIFSPARVEFRGTNNEFDIHCEITVSPEDDIELRKVRITNRARRSRTICITSYAEVVLAPAISDTLHPAFSNLFVQTQIIKERQAIICHRRPRSSNEQVPWMFHLMAAHGAQIKAVSYETSRAQFVGRDHTIDRPQALRTSAPLSGAEGSVLDPVVAVRHLITIGPEESALINIVTGIGETKESCLALVEKYQDWHLAERVFDLALTHSDVVLRQLNASESDAQLYAHLANSIIYPNPNLRADASIIAKNRRGQSGLWGYAISGDLPIVLLQIQEAANVDLVRQMIQAHAYWRLKGLKVDLVIWNEDRAGYRQVLQEQILGLIAAGAEANLLDKPGGLFLRSAEQIPTEDRILLQSVARIIITDSEGSLAQQANRRIVADTRLPRLVPSKNHVQEQTPINLPQRSDLIFFNGCGGFTADGREYVVTTMPGQRTPAPWSNVLANPTFGTVISESGSAYTWRENAHEFRITPWHNDPVSDICGEAFYIRDEETGYFWSPTPLPAISKTPYVSRHGFGYSVFEHKEDGISTELCIYVALDAPIKFSVLKVRNESQRYRRLSATGYIEWVLGDLRSKSAMHIVTELDPKSGALFARNPYSMEFADYVAFLDVDDVTRTVSGNRAEFLGRNGTMANPAAMTSTRLSGKLGAALDPCAAIQVPFDLDVGEEHQIIFRLGAGFNTEDATAIVNRFRGSHSASNVLESVFEYWKRTLGAVHIETPDQSLNVLTNGWLLYQTISARLWARSGYYQSGGAFGFRDQLQDTMALIHSEPMLLREQLLLCASRQFKEGDVQHWWHPPSGRGVRTHCSDDFLWLPLATCRYVLLTGDTGVLDAQIHFLEGRLLNPEEDSYYDLPMRSDEVASLYEHCVRSIQKGLNFGEHGLPLMLGGDWNDGMNLVGHEGKGESVWLAFFLYEVLRKFSKVAYLRGDQDFAKYCEQKAAQLQQNIEQHGWDGEWYRRAYFDNGSPLGSASDTECKIDSISQSWSVLSTAAKAERAHLAMVAVDKYLVRRESKLIQLLDPPFDKSDLDPGYIKGYVPGVRENGGQYTHAAIWTIMAFAALGDNQRAWELWSLVNPVNHGKTEQDIATYKVEPYVAAADVYAVSPHIGYGGWTWYTGSAGWMYRLITESLLGLKLDVDKLSFSPCLPADWQNFKIHYHYRESVYHITVLLKTKETGKSSVIVDGAEQPDMIIQLTNDRQDHNVEVTIRS